VLPATQFAAQPVPLGVKPAAQPQTTSAVALHADTAICVPGHEEQPEHGELPLRDHDQPATQGPRVCLSQSVQLGQVEQLVHDGMDMPPLVS
jgi:hypothetical protein